ncbi:hypothetical protein B7463_g10174, partial [Scytalidium lignicola]
MQSVKSLEASIAKESAIAKWIIAPLTFLSFLFSLAIIDTQNQAARTASHRGQRPSDSGVGLSLFWRLLYGDTHGPYAYVRSPAERSEGRDAAAAAGKNDGGAEKEGWYFHTKQRKLMKMEVSDAFRIRKRVALGMILVSVVMAWLNWVLLRYVTRLGMRWMSKFMAGV